MPCSACSWRPAGPRNVTGRVRALALEYNGALLVGGAFSEIGGDSRRLIARLSSISPTAEIISVDEDLAAATFTVGGASGEYASVAFSYSEDAESWTDLGSGERTGEPGEWRITGLTLPADGVYYLRVVGRTATNRYGSGGWRDIEAQFFGATPAVTLGCWSTSMSAITAQARVACPKPWGVMKYATDFIVLPLF